MISNLAKIMIFLGLVLVIIGGVILIAPKIPIINKLGQLPGDIRIKGERFSFYFPLTTCIIISVILTFLFYVMRRIK